jgi:uncharacterized protein (DUF736 family)
MGDFEHKPGRLSLFKNDRKETDTQPDYRGDGKLPDGSDVWVSAWIEQGKNGNKYFSLSVQPKDAVTERGVAEAKKAVEPEPLDDDIPF